MGCQEHFRALQMVFIHGSVSASESSRAREIPTHNCRCDHKMSLWVKITLVWHSTSIDLLRGKRWSARKIFIFPIKIGISMAMYGMAFRQGSWKRYVQKTHLSRINFVPRVFHKNSSVRLPALATFRATWKLWCCFATNAVPVKKWHVDEFNLSLRAWINLCMVWNYSLAQELRY